MARSQFCCRGIFFFSLLLIIMFICIHISSLMLRVLLLLYQNQRLLQDVRLKTVKSSTISFGTIIENPRSCKNCSRRLTVAFWWNEHKRNFCGLAFQVNASIIGCLRTTPRLSAKGRWKAPPKPKWLTNEAGDEKQSLLWFWKPLFSVSQPFPCLSPLTDKIFRFSNKWLYKSLPKVLSTPSTTQPRQPH